MNKVEILERRLRETCYHVYEKSAGGRRFKPMKPFVLVRVLPKEQIIGGIVLAETAQQKTVYEGIVIEVWEPYEETRRKRIELAWGDTGFETVFINHESKVHIGDRVAFPHWCGMPVGEYLDDKYYRFVKEEDLMGTLDYQGDAEISKQIRELTKKISSITTSGVSMSRGATPREVAQ